MKKIKWYKVLIFYLCCIVFAVGVGIFISREPKKANQSQIQSIDTILETYEKDNAISWIIKKTDRGVYVGFRDTDESVKTCYKIAKECSLLTADYCTVYACNNKDYLDDKGNFIYYAKAVCYNGEVQKQY